MTGLYIHLPFCRKRCHYCDFVIALSGPDGRHGLFLNAFYREAEKRAPQLRGVVFDTVYIGGGTPSTLEPEELTRFFEILSRHFRWTKGAEMTFEINPGDVGSRMADQLLMHGVNRASLGAQTFNDATLERINRTHHAAQIESSFKILRSAGFHNISMDLILSLPFETWADVQHSLTRAVALGPEHISMYELTVEEKSVFGAMHRHGKMILPAEDEQLETLTRARAYLIAEGFEHYELLNFAKPGFESRHNLLYWANEPYLGLGPGAWSYVEGVRYQYAKSYEEYMDKTSRNDWSNAEEDILDEERKERESFLLALRLLQGADAERFTGLIQRCREDIESLKERGLLEEEEGKIRLTGQGQFFAETVFTELSK